MGPLSIYNFIFSSSYFNFPTFHIFILSLIFFNLTSCYYDRERDIKSIFYKKIIFLWSDYKIHFFFFFSPEIANIFNQNQSQTLVCLKPDLDKSFNLFVAYTHLINRDGIYLVYYFQELSGALPMKYLVLFQHWVSTQYFVNINIYTVSESFSRKAQTVGFLQSTSIYTKSHCSSRAGAPKKLIILMK